MATAEYDKNNCTRINLKLNNKTDSEIIRKLGDENNVQGYIKQLIREDMKGERKMTFIKKTEQICGARNAGYRLDQLADREIDKDLAEKLIRQRGRRFVEDKLDLFYDFNGDLYEDENGEPYAVMFVYDGAHEVPLCWQRLRKAETYKIKPEYLDLWEGGDMPSDPDRIIDENQLETIARGWETPVSELLEQLIKQ